MGHKKVAFHLVPFDLIFSNPNYRNFLYIFVNLSIFWNWFHTFDYREYTYSLDSPTALTTTSLTKHTPCHSREIISDDRILDLLFDSLHFFLWSCAPLRQREHWLRTKTNTVFDNQSNQSYLCVRVGTWTCKQHWNKPSRLSFCQLTQ